MQMNAAMLNSSFGHSMLVFKKSILVTVIAAISITGIFAFMPAGMAQGRDSFGFNHGFTPGGINQFSGGGSYDLSKDTISTGGSFGNANDIIIEGVVVCPAGDGVRWDAEELLSGFTFGFGTVSTDDNTVVLKAGLYCKGGGNVAFVERAMIVSEKGTDINPTIAGNQNFWVQGLGALGSGLGAGATTFGTADPANFN